MCSWKLLLLCQPQLKMIALKWSRARFLLLFFSVLSPRSASFVDCYILLRPIFIFLFLSLDMHTRLCQCWFVVVGARTYIEGKGREALDRTCGLVLCGERENRLLVAWWWITMCEEESGSVLQTAAVTDCKSSGKRELSAAKKARKCFLLVAGYKNPFPFEDTDKMSLWFGPWVILFYFFTCVLKEDGRLLLLLLLWWLLEGRWRRLQEWKCCADATSRWNLTIDRSLLWLRLLLCRLAKEIG